MRHGVSWNFFTANIRNRNTREAYARAIVDFLTWCEAVGLHELGLLEPVYVAANLNRAARRYPRSAELEAAPADGLHRARLGASISGQAIAVDDNTETLSG